MRLGQKHTSSVSEAILKEQRQLRMERLLASPGLIIGLVGFLVILLTAVLIPLFSSVDPNAMVVSERLKPPSGEHFFGTDELGRDLFTRIMYGARVSLWVGGSVAVFSCILGDPVSPTNKLERKKEKEAGKLVMKRDPGDMISHLRCVAHVWILI